MDLLYHSISRSSYILTERKRLQIGASIALIWPILFVGIFFTDTTYAWFSPFKQQPAAVALSQP